MFLLTRELIAKSLVAFLVLNSNIVLIFGAKSDIISGVWWPLVSETYPNYKATKSLIKDMAKKYPNIVNYYTAGKSVAGRDMLVIRLAENVREPRPILRPMVKQVSSMHGDEVVGRALLLMLAVDIVKRYSERDPRVVKLLQTTDIHLMPSVNPDGFEEAEHTCHPNSFITGRNNKNNVDLNRDFPDQFTMTEEIKSDIYKNRQPETVNMMKYIKNYPFVLSTNLHGGAVVASYPFDSVPMEIDNDPAYNQANVPSVSPDDKVFKQLALDYSMKHKTMYVEDGGRPNCPFENFTYGITNGAAWYNVRGGMQDFNYVHSNCFELTVELSCCKYPPEAQLIKEWDNNKESLYNFMESVHWGAKGIVKDGQGKPIKGAKIIIKDISKMIKTTSNGEYWRLLVPGSYQIKVSAIGHHTTDFKNIIIEKEKTTIMDFTLQKMQ